jgi:hypothetical protein
MISRSSLFAQVVSRISRRQFDAAVREHGAEKGAKGFSCWDQFVAMLYAQMAGAHSLREICGGLATALGKLSHLGMKQAPSRSTLSYANAHRSWKVFESVFYSLLGEAQGMAARRQRRFAFKNPLRSLDATVIELCVQVFDWARFRRTKGAVKLHLMLDHQGCLPCWSLVTEGKTHEIQAARTLRFAPGTIVVVDRGYFDYALFASWCAAGVFFVTRLKSNALYRVVGKRFLPLGRNILSDEEIILTGKAAEGIEQTLRRIVVWDEANQQKIVLLTNHLDFGSTTVARLYKERWQIELFFKALKQHLKIKTFVGTSENAVRIQIWTALVAMLLLKMQQMRSRFGWSLSNLAALFRLNLLAHRKLEEWLDDPFAYSRVAPPQKPLPLFANILDSITGGHEIATGLFLARSRPKRQNLRGVEDAV